MIPVQLKKFKTETYLILNPVCFVVSKKNWLFLQNLYNAYSHVFVCIFMSVLPEYKKEIAST